MHDARCPQTVDGWRLGRFGLNLRAFLFRTSGAFQTEPRQSWRDGEAGNVRVHHLLGYVVCLLFE
jgi:hypothetical protein